MRSRLRRVYLQERASEKGVGEMMGEGRLGLWMQKQNRKKEDKAAHQGQHPGCQIVKSHNNVSNNRCSGSVKVIDKKIACKQSVEAIDPKAVHQQDLQRDVSLLQKTKL
jgi:hypothetical protein